MRITPLLLVGLCALPSLRAQDATKQQWMKNWPQWRGPLATGMSPDGEPPLKWDDRTNVKWKVPIPGKGSSTPIVWGDRVFVLTAEDTGKLAAREDIPTPATGLRKIPKAPRNYHRWIVLCLDRKTGKTLWRQVAREAVPHEGGHDSHSFGGFSPITDGKHLYALFGTQGLYCYDHNGRLLWKRDLGRMETRLGWGEAGSPAVDPQGTTVVVNWDHEGQDFLIAIEADTGKTRWKVDRNEPTSWATPLIVEHGDKTQVIVNATNKTRSYDLETGKLLWECGGQTLNAISSPVSADGVVYCMSGYKGSMAVAIRLDATGDVAGTDKLLWRYDRATPYVPSPLLAGDRLYFTYVNQPVLTCLDVKTGKAVIDRERLPGLTSLYASPTGTKKRIYIVDRDGTTLVLRRGDKLDVLATNRLDEPIDGSPVIVGKQLFLRGQRHLYCIEEARPRRPGR